MKLDSLRDLGKDDILGALGLAMRPSATDKWLGGLAWFGAGLAVGAGLALAFAPKSGRELRDDVSARLRSARDKAAQAMNHDPDASGHGSDADSLTP